jgi:hypothetical protein
VGFNSKSKTPIRFVFEADKGNVGVGEDDDDDDDDDEVRKGVEASERERCCSAINRSEIRFLIARSKKAVILSSAKYLLDS